MAASFHIFKNGAISAVTSAGKKTALAHGNGGNEDKGVGRFSQKIRSSGPISKKGS